MKTRTNQPIYKDDGTLLTDEDLGGSGLSLYKHTISLGNVSFLRSVMKETGITFERNSVVATLEIISKDSQNYTTLEDLLTYESDILTVHVNLGNNQKRLSVDVDVVSNVGFHIAYIDIGGNGTSVPYYSSIYRCELAKTTAITDNVTNF